jgi:hypothetical protein
MEESSKLNDGEIGCIDEVPSKDSVMILILGMDLDISDCDWVLCVIDEAAKEFCKFFFSSILIFVGQ